MYPEIEIAEDVHSRFPDILVKSHTLDDIKVEPHARFIKARRKRILKGIQTQFKDVEIADHPVIQAYRTLYDKIGLDPDETPPSVQSLITRFLTKNQFPNINSVVDCVNLATLESMIPLGVFDVDAIKGQIVLRFSRPAEPFLELGRRTPDPLDGGRLVLADDEKVLSVYYWRDSEYQKVAEDTTRVAVLSCRVAGVTDEMIDGSLRIADEILRTAHPSE